MKRKIWSWIKNESNLFVLQEAICLVVTWSVKLITAWLIAWHERILMFQQECQENFHWRRQLVFPSSKQVFTGPKRGPAWGCDTVFWYPISRKIISYFLIKHSTTNFWKISKLRNKRVTPDADNNGVWNFQVYQNIKQTRFFNIR